MSANVPKSIETYLNQSRIFRDTTSQASSKGLDEIIKLFARDYKDYYAEIITIDTLSKSIEIIQTDKNDVYIILDHYLVEIIHQLNYLCIIPCGNIYHNLKKLGYLLVSEQLLTLDIPATSLAYLNESIGMKYELSDVQCEKYKYTVAICVACQILFLLLHELSISG